MNTIPLIEHTRNIFSNLEEISTNFYKSELVVEDKVAGIYYLNFNKSITLEDFDLIQYKYLANEFYQQKESLQWNIYLLFINSDISNDLKLRILKDHHYARKLIFTGNEYLDYFKLEKSEKLDSPDIVSLWKNQLDSVGLQELYSQSSIKSVTNNFIENTVPKIISREEKNLDHIFNVEKISSIQLQDNYRPFPLERNFEFGSVNLFVGSNGVGKTSLMEAIELVLTGKAQRNPTKNEKEESIKAIYNNNIPDVYSHHNNTYKDRGAKWYERKASEHGNKTFESFNKFNFFNTDAATIFANSEHKENIHQALKQIVLGEEYTNLKSRILSLESELRPKFKRVSKEIEQANEQLLENTARINDLKSDRNIDNLIRNIRDNIKNLNYKMDISQSDFSISSLFVNNIKTNLQFIESNTWIISYKNFKDVKEDLLARNDFILKSENKINDINKKIISNKCENLYLNDLKKKIERLYEYIDFNDILSFDNIDFRLSNLKSEVSKIEYLKKISNIFFDSEKFKNSSENVSEFIFEKEKVIFEKKKELNAKLFEIKKIEENFIEFENLKNKIKYLGKEILMHHEDLDSCPLCEQKIHYSTLLLQIEKNIDNSVDKNLINRIALDVDDLGKIIVNLENDLIGFKSYFSELSKYITRFEELSFSEIYNYITGVLEGERDFLNEINCLEGINVKLNKMGGSYSEYISLQKIISKEYRDENILNKDILVRKLHSINESLIKNSVTIDNFDSEMKNIINDLNGKLKLKSYFSDFVDIKNIYQSRINKILAIESNFHELMIYINLEDEKLISDVSNELMLLINNLVTLKEVENSQVELLNLNKQNEIISSSLPNLKSLNSRLDKALKILTKMSSNSEDTILEDYFSKNLIEIKDIFTTIHSPREFTDIRYKNDTLILFKNDQEYTISEISTGQRAALVLSIFLSLNRKLINGPNILIFDDPVTFIDDFNALSFLDFLRYFIVKEKKQIFFATANKKFAGLFQKKFNFLGEGQYKEFNFSRSL